MTGVSFATVFVLGALFVGISVFIVSMVNKEINERVEKLTKSKNEGEEKH